METASFAASILALAGLFNDAVDCFEYIQLGRNCGKDFQTCLLKLDDARLRLSRRGQSAGLSGDLNNMQALQRTLRSEQNIEQATFRLEQIFRLFREAERVSNQFRARAKAANTTSALYVARDLEPIAASLHRWMYTLATKRQSHIPLRKKSKWALYEEKHFRKLIIDVTDLVGGLTELFPATEASQRALCEIEASELDSGNLAVLRMPSLGKAATWKQLSRRLLSEARRAHRMESSLGVIIRAFNWVSAGLLLAISFLVGKVLGRLWSHGDTMDLRFEKYLAQVEVAVNKPSS